MIIDYSAFHLKQIIATIFLLSWLITTNAQQQLPNNSFESWQSLSMDTIPAKFSYDFSESSYYGQSTDSYSGDYSAVVNSYYGYVPGRLVIGDNPKKIALDFNDNWKKIGVPFSSRPTTLRGYYKYTVPTLASSLDSCSIQLLLRKASTSSTEVDEIGNGKLLLSLINKWTFFEMPINYVSSDVPDTLSLVAISHETGSGGFPSLDWNNFFYLDSLSFYYSTTTGTEPTPTIKNSVYIYPNPVINRLTIEAEKDELDYFTIFNILVKDVTKHISSTIKGGCLEIDMSNLNVGLYILRTKTTSNRVYKI